MASDPYLAQFEAVKSELPGADLAWLNGLREAGLRQVADLGLPTPKVEAWRYTNLNALRKIDFHPAPALANGVDATGLPTLLAPERQPLRLAFVNGRFRADLSSLDELPAGVTLAPLADRIGTIEGRLGSLVKEDVSPLVGLNTAMTGDGVVLEIAANVTIERPIELVFVGGLSDDAVAWHPRNLILAGENSEATIVEQHVGLGGGQYFANSVTELVAEAGARLRHYRLQDEGAGGFHVNTLLAHIAGSAVLDNFVLSLGGQLSRNEIHVRLDGPGAEVRLNGAYAMTGRQHCDTTTFIDHASPNTSSSEVYKGVLDERARAVFQGKIAVRPQAQKTDGHQLSRALLLSPTCEIDTKPELEIYADDVKCSHGATAGELEDDALFYLRSRGVPEAEARNMLVTAFLDEIVDEIADEQIRDAFRARVEGWLADRVKGEAA